MCFLHIFSIIIIFKLYLYLSSNTILSQLSHKDNIGNTRWGESAQPHTYHRDQSSAKFYLCHHQPILVYLTPLNPILGFSYLASASAFPSRYDPGIKISGLRAGRSLFKSRLKSWTSFSLSHHSVAHHAALSTFMMSMVTLLDSTRAFHQAEQSHFSSKTI